MSSPPETERPRPCRWKDDGRPQGSPLHIPTSPAPTGTKPLPRPVCKNLPVKTRKGCPYYIRERLSSRIVYSKGRACLHPGTPHTLPKLRVYAEFPKLTEDSMNLSCVIIPSGGREQKCY